MSEHDEAPTCEGCGIVGHEHHAGVRRNMNLCKSCLPVVDDLEPATMRYRIRQARDAGDDDAAERLAFVGAWLDAWAGAPPPTRERCT